MDRDLWKTYFEQPGLARLMDAVRRKFEVLGAKGNVTIDGLTRQESDAISSLMEEYWPPGKPAVISLRKLEQRLVGNAFGGGIRDMLEVLDGCPVMIRSERKMIQEESWQRLIANAASAAGLTAADPDGTDAPLYRWLEQLKDRTAAGSRTLHTLAEADVSEAERQLGVCLTAIIELLNRQASGDISLLRLPVFAAAITGDAHAFDWKDPLGRLLVSGLQAVWGRGESREALDKGAAVMETEGEEEENAKARADETPADAAQAEGALLRRELYRSAGIADDDISSQVIFYAPSWKGDKEERILTLRQVERVDSVPRVSTIYGVENPSLFGTFLDRGLDWSREDKMLLCVSGYPSSAVLRWLDRCLETQGRDEPVLQYSGDLDVQGLEIAVFLHRRYGSRFRPWRMAASDYESVSMRGIPLNETERSRLKRLVVPWDEMLIPTMLVMGRKVFQELLIEKLWEDVK